MLCRFRKHSSTIRRPSRSTSVVKINRSSITLLRNIVVSRIAFCPVARIATELVASVWGKSRQNGKAPESSSTDRWCYTNRNRSLSQSFNVYGFCQPRTGPEENTVRPHRLLQSTVAILQLVWLCMWTLGGIAWVVGFNTPGPLLPWGLHLINGIISVGDLCN